jgi:hypothetical protein
MLSLDGAWRVVCALAALELAHGPLGHGHGHVDCAGCVPAFFFFFIIANATGVTQSTKQQEPLSIAKLQVASCKLHL